MAIPEAEESVEYDKFQVNIAVVKHAFAVNMPPQHEGILGSARIVERREDYYGEHFAMAVRAEFMEGDTYVVDSDQKYVPKTWWDHFKHDHVTAWTVPDDEAPEGHRWKIRGVWWLRFLLWAGMIKPAQYDIITIRTEFRNVCPHIPTTTGRSRHDACVEFLVRRPPRAKAARR